MIKRLIEKLKTLRLYFVSGSCDCGAYKKCPRKVKVDYNGGVVVENTYECIKIQKFNYKLNEWWDKNYH
jgi:hypothetical protein